MEPSTAVQEKTFQDMEGCNAQPAIIKQLAPGEKIVFSCQVIKYNRWTLRQLRTLMLTNMALYNLKETAIKRRISIMKVRALSRSSKKGCIEFVVHVKGEYDYRFDSESRKSIFDAIKFHFWKNHKANIPVFEVPDSLKEYHTSKKDQDRGVDILPPAKWRKPEEDIYQAERPASAIKQVTKEAAMPDPQSFSPTDMGDPQAAFDIQMQQKEIGADRGQSIYVRKKEYAEATLQDFIPQKVIGKGSFGKVFLVQNKNTKKVYAMKALRKDVILDYDQLQSTILEKQILQKADHPFLVGMEFVFQTAGKLYFIMKFVRGGELFSVLRKQRSFGEKRAKFYSLTVAMALGHLHKQKIIYRDLKPENILMGEDGYIQVTDFGLAKILDQGEMAMSFCGTPEYMAPEILDEKGHTFPVDWWALGVLTYEMIVSFPPFYTGNGNQEKMFELIKNKQVFFPDAKKHGIEMSDECKDFINLCLQKKPEKRIGSKGGIDEILAHPWFADYDIEAMYNKQYTPDYIPKLGASVLDVSNFDKMFTSEEVKDTVVDQSAMRKIKKAAGKFSEFDN